MSTWGEILFLTFRIDDAIDKAAEAFCLALDEAEDWTEIQRQAKIWGDWT